MAKLALTIAGGAAGFLAGGPAGIKWGLMAGAALGGMLEAELAPDLPRLVGPNLESLRVQSSAYGSPVTKLWGTMRLAGNIFWAGGFYEYSYTVGEYTENAYINEGRALSLGVGICEGPIEKILRIWADGEVIWDHRGSNYTTVEAVYFTARFYLGAESQEPDSWMDNIDGSNNTTPAYRGIAYVVFQEFPLHKFGNRVPNFEFEVSTNAQDTVSHTIYDGVTAASTDKDNVVFYPNNLHFAITSENKWYKINTYTNEVLFEVEHSDPEIPLSTGGFDIDEKNIIHTCKEGSSGFAKLCQLDGDTFAEIDAATTQIKYAEVIHVCRNSNYPFIAAIPLNAGVGETIHITHRTNYTFGGGIDEITLTAPAGTEWGDIDFDDDTGVLWAVAKSIAGTSTTIVQINIFGNGSYTRQEWTVTEIEKADSITYDGESDTLVLGSATQLRIACYDAADPSTHFGSQTFNDVGWNMKSVFQHGVIDGYLYFSLYSELVYYHTVYKLSVADVSIANLWNLDESGLCNCGSGDTFGSCYDSLTHSMIMACSVHSDADYLKMYLDRGTGTPVPLSEIVDDICASVGLDGSGDVDTSELTDLVIGYGINKRLTAREALQVLMDTYFFDCVDTDGTLQFVKRGGASIVTISESDLAAHVAGGERPQELVTIRQQEMELPCAIDVIYIDVDAGYVVGLQRAQRLITESNQIITLQLPVVLDHDEAKQIAEKHLANAWMQRNRHMIQTHRGYSYLDPSDVITLTENSNSHIVRIEDMGLGSGVVFLQLVSEQASLYTSEATGVELPEPEDEDVEYPGPTLLLLIDCPLLNSANNVAGIYVATMGYTSQWTGAMIFKNSTGVWEPLDRPWLLSSLDAKIGKATTVLADVTDPWVWDEGSTITIRLLDSSDTLANATELQVLNGANFAVLGNEIIQWRTATLNADGTYTLSGLLRGRKGSEWATGTHAIGNYFTIMGTSLLTFVEMSIDEKDVAQWYRAASYGMFVTTGETQTFTATFRNMMPWSPQEIAGTRDSSNNLTITWTRRTRIGGEWADGGDVSLGETAESYSLDIYDGSTVVRTIAVTAETASYTAAQQVDDFGSVQSSVDVIVYQISSVVGRGFGTEVTV